MKHELEQFTIRHILERSAERHAERIALVKTGEEEHAITYGDLKRKVDAVATYLIDHDIQVGDRVAILGESQPMWGVAYLAVVSAGAVAVPILPDFSSKEIDTILRHSESKACVVSTKLFEKIATIHNERVSMLLRMEDLFHVPDPISPTLK